MENISISAPMNFGTFTVIAIDRTRIYSQQAKHHIWWHGRKEPLAVIVCDEHGIFAYMVPQGAVALTEVQRQYPKLADAITRYVAQHNLD